MSCNCGKRGFHPIPVQFGARRSGDPAGTRSGERQDPPLRASVAFGLGGWCCLRRRQVSNAFQSGKHLGYGAARAVIARVRNTANIAISSFNYLLVKHVMCHVHILDFLKERRKLRRPNRSRRSYWA